MHYTVEKAFSYCSSFPSPRQHRTDPGGIISFAFFNSVLRGPRNEASDLTIRNVLPNLPPSFVSAHFHALACMNLNCIPFWLLREGLFLQGLKAGFENRVLGVLGIVATNWSQHWAVGPTYQPLPQGMMLQQRA